MTLGKILKRRKPLSHHVDEIYKGPNLCSQLNIIQAIQRPHNLNKHLHFSASTQEITNLIHQTISSKTSSAKHRHRYHISKYHPQLLSTIHTNHVRRSDLRIPLLPPLEQARQPSIPPQPHHHELLTRLIEQPLQPPRIRRQQRR